ncbi:MAG: SufD family Fe-S cluster assembly protein [Maricaulaceae bacterium]|nr:SufD family Fe-S cluster assembly protein [Maricaulaceae bacterium]
MNAHFKPHDGEAALIAALDGASGWRAELRDALSAQGLPAKRAEAWKWTDLRRALSGLSVAQGALAFESSRPADRESPVEHAPQNLLPRLAAALGGDALVFRLSDGEHLTLAARAEAGAGHRIVLVEVPDGAAARVTEHYGAGEGGFTNIAILYRLGAGARLDRVVESGGPGVIVVSGGAEIGARSRFHQTEVTFGGVLCRLETHLLHPGEGAEAVLNAVYLLHSGRHADLTSVTEHTGPGGSLSQLCKGAAAGGAQGVFRGKIVVRRAAQKTDARMNHRALLLDSKAEIDAKPELEIYADDVQCAHGNALGQLDRDALFYLRQRSLPEAQARALLIESFLAEPLQPVTDEAVRDRLSARLRQGLEGLS